MCSNISLRSVRSTHPTPRQPRSYFDLASLHTFPPSYQPLSNPAAQRLHGSCCRLRRGAGTRYLSPSRRLLRQYHRIGREGGTAIRPPAC
ncbi:unnamed protein product [Chondrus crispus]|uniref:Uncharacterized protein n=1 Tax=Chondrus crispus TaxID=2769 RepID=R7QFT9_CHOCR|nr:unnamed protein product [Chondrus crispus]XP_005716109.1 unnamed protein product [Chondrus crispus]CDF32458.1 unnamed protein product [Chondrus crispus]CDF36290.1 unnamed protein product [Chondrus crispus]|eukprot:XP_005712123.1 unnamed protein product [Chondrus crispus]